jgi:hypothetical protein
LGDFDGSGKVGNDDLTLLLDDWGLNLNDLQFIRDVDGDNIITQADVDNVGDINGDGFTNQLDKDIVMEQFGLDLSMSILL